MVKFGVHSMRWWRWCEPPLLATAVICLLFPTILSFPRQRFGSTSLQILHTGRLSFLTWGFFLLLIKPYFQQWPNTFQVRTDIASKAEQCWNRIWWRDKISRLSRFEAKWRIRALVIVGFPNSPGPGLGLGQVRSGPWGHNPTHQVLRCVNLRGNVNFFLQFYSWFVTILTSKGL